MTLPEKRRPGRPNAADPRQTITVRVTSAERVELVAAAEAAELGLSVYVRDKALAAARRRRPHNDDRATRRYIGDPDA